MLFSTARFAVMLSVSQTGRLLWFAVALTCFTLISACTQSADGERQSPGPAGIFVPERAKDLERHERRGIREVTYQVPEAYPASQFLCELTDYLDQHTWSAVREDALNPGTPSGVIRGWTDFEDATRKPEMHVHAWASQWLNDRGELLTYGLTYEYQEGSRPDLSTLRVSAFLWPADFVRGQLGNRAEQLKSLLLPPARSVRKSSHQTEQTQCTEPAWSEFVKSKAAGASAVLALPFELNDVQSIDIQSDIDGLASRIASALKAKVPQLRVGTVHEHLGELSDATLDFRSDCRCNEPGAPNGFYIREAVLYRAGVAREWIEPTRVLFYWTDSGDPPWKHVPANCFAQNRSSSCERAFKQADIDFTNSLASALVSVK